MKRHETADSEWTTKRSVFQNLFGGVMRPILHVKSILLISDMLYEVRLQRCWLLSRSSTSTSLGLDL